MNLNRQTNQLYHKKRGPTLYLGFAAELFPNEGAGPAFVLRGYPFCKEQCRGMRVLDHGSRVPG